MVFSNEFHEFVGKQQIWLSGKVHKDPLATPFLGWRLFQDKKVSLETVEYYVVLIWKGGLASGTE